MRKLITLSVVLACFSCQKDIFIEYGQGLADWSEETHSSDVGPDYSIVFNQTEVNRIDLVFTADDWSDMQSDLSSVVSSSGGGGGPGGAMTFSDQTPLYFECQLFFNDIQWYHVGVRYKGNSSLTASTNKLPLRFKFDEFEDEYPEITNQSFYGFKELSLRSNYNDAAVMRDKTANDLFRNFGVPAVRSAFCEIWIDKGTGTSEYYGVYTMNEVVFDSFLADYFGSDTGNCYKPDGDGATFSSSSFSLADFELKNNTDADKAEIRELYYALQSPQRNSDPAAWQAALELVFDVDGFLRYLAANNTIQNWDTYGNMTHNYYLYHDPTDDLLKWIVWDNNEAFQSDSGPRAALSLSMDEVGTGWPLINFLIGYPEYEAKYEEYLSSFVSSSFSYGRMNGIYTSQEVLLSASVANERSGYSFVNGSSNFSAAVNNLKIHCGNRVSAVNDFL